VRIRVITYNVRSFRAGVTLPLEAIAAEGESADVVALQEYGPPHRLRAFARALGMDWASSYAPFNRLRNAVLFRSPWRLVQADPHRLTKTPGQHRRGFVAARLEVPGTELTAVSVHLGLSVRERPRHAGELLALLGDGRGPLVLAGDFNEGPDGPAMRSLAGAFTACGESAAGGEPTFPAAEPVRRIDDVLVRAARILSCRVADSDAARRASDHRPVIAELELLPPSGPVG
jgi:endonuclease/exonuclease/phosphatase family metal-dependent hydrolase